MTDKEEWGPWIEHDGRGCPCLGQYVQVQNRDRKGTWEGIAGSEGGLSWDWSNAFLFDPVIRYRIRKPRGLTILQDLIADLPQPAKEDA